MKASEKGRLAVVQLLLNFNADVHLKDWNHRTALRIAQQGHYRNIEDCLKEHKQYPKDRAIVNETTDTVKNQKCLVCYEESSQRGV